ncbi:hypothetical protein NQZ68_027521 [Dissostichus eleginoides]|nr:hypothetical protein NQZ68_027521 [Dissostichus eleginoides]
MWPFPLSSCVCGPLLAPAGAAGAAGCDAERVLGCCTSTEQKRRCGHGSLSARLRNKSAVTELLFTPPASWRLSLMHHGSSSAV